MKEMHHSALLLEHNCKDNTSTHHMEDVVLVVLDDDFAFFQ